jgi:hypothetical protein
MPDVSKAAGRNVHHLCLSVPGGEPAILHAAHWNVARATGAPAPGPLGRKAVNRRTAVSKKARKSAADLLLTELRKILGKDALVRFATWLRELKEKSDGGEEQFVGWANSGEGPVAVWLQEQLKHEFLDSVILEPNGVCVYYYIPFQRLGRVGWITRFDKALRKQHTERQEVSPSEALQAFEKAFVTKEV